MELHERKAQLIASCSADPAVTSLVFFGSSTEAASHRRDEWSDLDFNVFFTTDANNRQRANWGFLPHPDQIVLRTREGDNGGAVVYEDATLLEFGAGQPWPIRDPSHEVAVGGDDLIFADPPAPPDAANAVQLFLVKLYIGVGRYRRGERIAAHAHVRTHAVEQLCWALRRHLEPEATGSPFDPTQGLEKVFPEVAAELADLLDQDIETCARGLFNLARTQLEPGWPGFPAEAADTIARRLGWDHGPKDGPR